MSDTGRINVYQNPWACVRSDHKTHTSGKGIEESLNSLKSMALCSAATSGVLAVGTLSKLLLTLTRFVATRGEEPSVLVPLDGLPDLELPVLVEPCSDVAL
jgi:hypothetical protein